MDLLPIPEKKLIFRLKPVFSRLDSRQSAALIGLHGSGRTSHVRFVLSQQKYLSRLLPKSDDNLRVIFLSSDSLITKSIDSFVRLLTLEIRKTFTIDDSRLFARTIDQALLSGDVYLILNSLTQTLGQIIKKSKVRYLLVIDQLENLSDLDSFLGNIFRSLWQIERVQPIENISFLFLGSPASLADNTSALGTDVKNIVGENIFLYPLLDQVEADYSLKRHAALQGKKLSAGEILFLKKFLGACGSCFRYATQLQDQKLDIKELEENLLNSEVIRSQIQKLWSGLGKRETVFLNKFLATGKLDPQSKLSAFGVIRNGEITAQIIRKLSPFSFGKLTDKKQIILGQQTTPQEENLYHFFTNNSNKVVSKDELAEVLWGQNYLEKYSDWAMAKLISRLRKKLTSANQPVSLLTLKGRGYKLIT